MKTIVVLAASIVFVSILFCPMVMAVPSMPADLQIVQPDPSLPKGLSDFFGKWESISNPQNFFVIVEKIDDEKASLYVWTTTPDGNSPTWGRREAKVTKERGKYILWSMGRFSSSKYTLKGEYLDLDSSTWSTRLRRVP